MFEIELTDDFKGWLDRLRDRTARAKILLRLMRLMRLRDGNPGDVKPVGKGVSELRIPHGPGYRVYYIQRGATIIVILSGGDKSTQGDDIKRAIALAELERRH